MSIHKYQTKNGVRYKVKIYRLLDGVRKDYIKGGFKTLKEAKSHQATIEYQKSKGLLEAPQRLSESLYGDLYEQWYKSYQNTVEPTTSSRTADIFRLHILPVFGERKIKTISPMECQDFITDKGKSFTNIKHLKSYTSKVFEFAVKMKLLKYDPMAEVILPKKKRKQIDNYWSVQELREFLTIVQQEEPYKHYALFRLLAFSGLRKGELYALKWADIDFQTETLSISKSLGRVDGKAIEKGTKNEFSMRKVKLDCETVQILQEWRRQSHKEKAQLSLAPLSIEQDFIFTYLTQAGKIEPLHADYINNVLKRITRKHHLKKISPHGFRHTHATLMLEIGVDPVNTAKRLGHASSQMTLDTYSHVTAKGQERSISRFSDYLSTK